MSTLDFLLFVLAYGFCLIYLGMRIGKKLQNHKVHSIVFPDEKFNIIFRKAKQDGEKFYYLIKLSGICILFSCTANLIKYGVVTNYEIGMFVYVFAGMVVVVQITLMSFSDWDGFWIYGSGNHIDMVIRNYELQNFKPQSQWQEIIGEYPIETHKYNANKYIGTFGYYFFLVLRIALVISLFCFFVSMLINLFY